MEQISLIVILQDIFTSVTSLRLTISGGGPLYWLAVVRAFQFLGDQFEGEYLLIYLDVRSADVHRHLWIQLLTREAVAHDRIQVLAGVSAIPTLLLHSSVTAAAALVVVIASPPDTFQLLLGLALSLRVPPLPSTAA